MALFRGDQISGSVASASFALTASYAINAGGGAGFPYSGSAVITGSLLISGSGLVITGSQNIAGDFIVNSLLYNYTSSSLKIGNGSIASGQYSLAQGDTTTASGLGSHAEGLNTIASGDYSHAEGNASVAQGVGSHAEGSSTLAEGADSHAQGESTIARGVGSHAEGFGTTAEGNYQHVQGIYNITSSAQGAFIIGNGSSLAPSNLLFASGSIVQITGSLTATSGFSGSLNGTASWANNAISSSYALNATSASKSEQTREVDIQFNHIGAGPYYITFTANEGFNTIQADNGLLYNASNNSITASFFQGTASYASQALTASFAISASYIDGGFY